MDVNLRIDPQDAITKFHSTIILRSIQNSLEHTYNIFQNSGENLTSYECKIRDVDIATEMMNFTKNNILAKASQFMIAYANTSIY
ncbi:hypothetical protein HBE96_01985 [Clostridium sp. P21]|uniref:Flagellin C-terminal domain-containing protein n=1 Tax=Clostridium muellerianum TaxID=2716538 RepID=A0A7Y0EDR2_9CLOT|nr:hypothetical protein [Clostridium muellerianum]